jgi:ABC transport system ATP-binding/permease protein
VKEYAGGYDDYLRQRPPPSPAAVVPAAKTPKAPSTPAPAAARKLSFKERRELEALPQRIEDLESRQKALHLEMAAPDYHRQGGPRISAARSELEAIERDLTAAYSRWEELDAADAGSGVAS